MQNNAVCAMIREILSLVYRSPCSTGGRLYYIQYNRVGMFLDNWLMCPEYTNQYLNTLVNNLIGCLGFFLV